MTKQRTANVQMSRTVEAVCSDKLVFLVLLLSGVIVVGSCLLHRSFESLQQSFCSRHSLPSSPLCFFSFSPPLPPPLYTPATQATLPSVPLIAVDQQHKTFLF